MDQILEAKINNIINEMTNQISKDNIDSSTSRALMAVAINRISLLMTHIGYIEGKLSSTIESNQTLALHADNLIAENQRLSSIVKY
jgi:hypothetical protein